MNCRRSIRCVLGAMPIESARSNRFMTRRTMKTLLSCVSNQTDEHFRIFSAPSNPLRLMKHTFYTPNITFESFQNCSLVKNAAILHVRSDKPIRKKSDRVVAFQMISDNLTDTQIQVGVDLNVVTRSWIASDGGNRSLFALTMI